MPFPCVSKSGDNQTVRIPADLACEDTNIDLTIGRYGDVIVVAPARRSLGEMAAALRALPKPSPIEAYEPMEAPEHDG